MPTSPISSSGMLVLPFGMLGKFSKLGATAIVWLNVPVSVLVAWIFTTFDMVGNNGEDPFKSYVNDVPMTAIRRNLEVTSVPGIFAAGDVRVGAMARVASATGEAPRLSASGTAT